MSKLTTSDFTRIFKHFTSPVSQFDCGRKCAPLNKGEPVCCSTQHAVPVVEKAEWQLLRTKSDLWHRFKAYDHATRLIVNDLPSGCSAVECKGARFCERDNRSLSCRTFPFYPYITKDREFIGLGIYWTFTDRCWLMSNLQIVDRRFINEFVAAYTDIFSKDTEELETFVAHSATARRVHSRWKRPLILLAKNGQPMKVIPGNGNLRPCKLSNLPKFEPFDNERNYRRAIKEAAGSLPAEGLKPV